MIKRIIIFLSTGLLIAFISCFGGGGGGGAGSPGSSSGNNVKWGYLLPETKGIYYSCGDLSGKTGPEGRFEYYDGQNVRFYLGGVELGTVAGQKIVTPFTLAGEDTVPTEIQDGATDTELNNHPAARNIMHFLLAINELHTKYDNLAETFEDMHTALGTKSIDFSVTEDVSAFQVRLNNLNSGGGKAISLGGLNSINIALIRARLTGLNTTTNTYNTTKPGYADQYGSIDYAGVSNPPVNGQILTQAQLNGVWIAEWDIYGDREDNNNPDSAYRDEYVQFPQKNYIVRMDGSQLEEDFICSEYQTYYTFTLSNPSDMRQGRYVKIDGPIASKQAAYANNVNCPDYPNTIYYEDWDFALGHSVFTPYPKDSFINTWKANNGEYKHELFNDVYYDSIISYSSNSEYAILSFPDIDDFDDGLGDRRVGDAQYLFTKPVNGRVKVYAIFHDGDGNARPMELLRTIRKVADNTLTGAVDASWPVD